MADTLVFHAGPLTRAIEAIVAAGGSEPREAKLVADNLVGANLTGHDSHGVGMIPRYIDALIEGGLEPNRHPAATLDAGALLALDGRKGYGQARSEEHTSELQSPCNLVCRLLLEKKKKKKKTTTKLQKQKKE